jgi:hypothetical protein
MDCLFEAHFDLFPIQIAEGEVQYRAAAVYEAVRFFRITGGGDFTVNVPRELYEQLLQVSAENLVRHAIGMALRDDLFNNPPTSYVQLDGDAPAWRGNLTKAMY